RTLPTATYLLSLPAALPIYLRQVGRGDRVVDEPAHPRGLRGGEDLRDEPGLVRVHIRRDEVHRFAAGQGLDRPLEFGPADRADRSSGCLDCPGHGATGFPPASDDCGSDHGYSQSTSAELGPPLSRS